MSVESFTSVYTAEEITRLNEHFKKMVTKQDGTSHVDDENAMHYSDMVKLALTKVIGKSGSKYVLVAGSAPQNLKCVSEDEQGDADILLLSSFPTLTKEDQERSLVPCEEPGFFKLKQVNARRYPFVKRNGTKYLNANSLREFESVWFADELQLLLLVVESLNHEYDKATRGKLASSLSWRSSSATAGLGNKNGYYFQVFFHSYKRNVLPHLNESAKQHGQMLVNLLWRILTVASMYGAGETNLAIKELEKLGPEFDDGLVPAFLGLVRKTLAIRESFIGQKDAKYFLKAYKYFESVVSEEDDGQPVSPSAERTVRGSFDLVPAISCHGFPAVAFEWKNRVKGKPWPHPDIVSKILKSGFHLVPKVFQGPRSDPSTSFRLGFVVAEQLLAQSATKFQKECYRVFKMYFYEKLKRKPKVLTTYHLKTIFFWTLETSDAKIWHERNRGYCCMLLMHKMKVAISEVSLQHYFIHGNNLFRYLDKDELMKDLNVLDDLLRDPVAAKGEIIAKIERFYSTARAKQQSWEDEIFTEAFFTRADSRFENVMDKLKSLEPQMAEMTADEKVNFLLLLTDPAKMDLLRFCFDMILARHHAAKFYGLFEKNPPFPSPLATLVQSIFPVSNEIIRKVIFPQAKDESKFKKIFQKVDIIIKVASNLNHEQLLGFARIKNAFAKTGVERFAKIAHVLENLPFFRDEL